MTGIDYTKYFVFDETELSDEEMIEAFSRRMGASDGHLALLERTFDMYTNEEVFYTKPSTPTRLYSWIDEYHAMWTSHMAADAFEPEALTIITEAVHKHNHARILVFAWIEDCPQPEWYFRTYTN